MAPLYPQCTDFAFVTPRSRHSNLSVHELTFTQSRVPEPTSPTWDNRSNWPIHTWFDHCPPRENIFLRPLKPFPRALAPILTPHPSFLRIMPEHQEVIIHSNQPPHLCVIFSLSQCYQQAILYATPKWHWLITSRLPFRKISHRLHWIFWLFMV